MSAEIEAEARAFGRCLVGIEPPAELVARYQTAVRRLMPEVPERAEDALVAYARRHPWSTPYLDAAAALFDPAGPLRARLLVMAAILETSPRFADAFLPTPSSRLRLVGRLAVVGLSALWRAAVGACLYAVARARA